jgi:hypothetical protein
LKGLYPVSALRVFVCSGSPPAGTASRNKTAVYQPTMLGEGLRQWMPKLISTGSQYTAAWIFSLLRGVVESKPDRPGPPGLSPTQGRLAFTFESVLLIWPPSP